MMRVVLINLFMFLLPFLVYGAYVYFVRSNRDADSIWRGAPITWLVTAGVILAVGTLIGLVTFTGEGTEGTYVPPRMEDGVIKPGHVDSP